MSKKGGMMAKNIHDCHADDDVQTDEDCRQNAIRCQQRSFRQAFTKFTEDGISEIEKREQVKNRHLEGRYHLKTIKFSGYSSDE
jgi:hypothetical protein